MIKGGVPNVTIILPEETEFDHYVQATPVDIDALARQRFPKASPEKLELVKKSLPAAMKVEADRVGDEEKLADEELMAFIKQMSGAELVLKRLKKREEMPKGNLVFLGADLAMAIRGEDYDDT